MMKKCIVIFTIALAAAAGCKKGGKYSDLKDFMNDIIDSNEEYISALEKASSAKDVAVAINNLSDKNVKYLQRGEELEKKYPELKDFNKKNHPPELNEVYKRIEDMDERMVKASMKMMKYAMDAEVMKASKDMHQKVKRFDYFK